MKPVRLGAVDYLNARPLVYGLELHSHEFALQFDPPSKCAALLHEGSIDVGMIPTIEFQRGHEDYRAVPGMAITSDGPVASVALFATVPIDRIRTIAADTSSRTSNALLRVLCFELFGIDPEFVPMAPDPRAMVQRCDAALLIGDPALFLDHESLALQKIDLGEAWTRMTRLPFVWAFWAGRARALTASHVRHLADARDRGVKAAADIAAAYCGAERAAQGEAYLRENIRYLLGEREEQGLLRYYELAEKHGLIDEVKPVEYYEAR